MTDIIAFWGCELTGSNKENTWSPGRGGDAKGGWDDMDSDEMMLTLSQACVGAEAKDEWNVVDVQTITRSGQLVQHSILQLKRDSVPHCQLSLLLTSEATFKLVKGTGPVHITGEERITLGPRGSDESDEEVVEQTEEAVTQVTGSKKAGLPPAAVIKPSPVKDSGAGKQPAAKPGKKKDTFIFAEADVEDSDDEDDSGDEDDLELVVEGGNDSEDEDESEEDNEEEEEHTEPPSKKKKMAGSQPKVAKMPPSKGVLSQERKSKLGKQQGLGKSLAPAGQSDIEKIKEKLLQSPNVPKKKERFHNFVKNTYRVQDEKNRNEIWDWWQKQKKH